ncbi:MAG: hypothetical protein VX701_00215 [Chloroflexota bacterium]|mgnify:CR=1 FL=1|nr:hypothetical protein [Chloroflexota bacterium]
MKIKQKTHFSRRSFLKGLPVGIIGAISLGVLSRNLFSKRSRGQGSPEFAKDSIFRPDDRKVRKS